MESFSAKTKASVIENKPKRKCCTRMLELGLNYTEDKTIAEYASEMKCASCAQYFIAGLFVSRGSVTDPEKRYHLDLRFKTDEAAESIARYLRDGGLSPKSGKRRGCSIVYFKESGAIEDFLAFAGANSAAFDMMNSKIVRELRGNANRVVNCDTANIKKTLEASGRSLSIINEMIESGAIEKLPRELKETALLRVKYEQLTLGELGERHEKPISKSGVKHRLEKITELYESLKQ